MHVPRKIFFSAALLALLLTTTKTSAQTSVLNADPDFDTFEAQPTDAWQAYKIGNSGPAVYRSSMVEGWPKPPALHLSKNTTFDGGAYQIVNVTPGKGYHFEVGWAAVSYNGAIISPDPNAVARRTGIDPYGGTNPLASTVVWSPEHRDYSHFQLDDLKMDQYARNSKLTIFLRAKSDFTGGHVDVFFDHALLTENTSMGTISIAAPTATSAPATATRTRTVTVARVAQAPGATASPSSTNTVEPTATATDTVRPIASRTPRPTATPEETSDSGGASGLMVALLALGGLGVGGVALVGFGIVVFRLLGRR